MVEAGTIKRDRVMTYPAVSRSGDVRHGFAHHAGKLTGMARRAAAGNAGMIHARVGECHGVGMARLTWQQSGEVAGWLAHHT